MAFTDGNFFILIAAQNLGCFHIANFVAGGNFFVLDRHFLKASFCILLKTVYQYLFTFASIIVLHKAG